MLEILEYALGGFWRFLGFVIISGLFLHYIATAIVLTVQSIAKIFYKKRKDILNHVWERWCNLDYEEFDKWLHDNINK